MSAPVVIPYIGLARPSVLNATAAARISTFLILFFMLFANNSALSHNVGTHSFSSGPKVTRVADDATREFRTARWYPPVESHSEITVSHHTVKVTTTHLHAHTLLPSHPHPPSGRLRTVQILCHPLLTAPFAGNLDVPSWLPRWERSLPLPFPLSRCPQSSSSSSSSRPSFRTTPFTSDTGVPPGCLVGSARGFPSRPVVHVIRLTRVVDFHFRRLASFGGSPLPIFPSEYSIWSMRVALFPRLGFFGLATLGPWSTTPGLILRRRPLTTVGRPSPTAVAESQW